MSRVPLSAASANSRNSLAPSSNRMSVGAANAKNNTRMSLAAPSATANSRPSTGGGLQQSNASSNAVVTTGRSSSIGTRLSVAPAGSGGGAASTNGFAGGRRSTLSSQMTTKEDPRPIKENSFRLLASQRIIEYLVTKGYDKPLNVKMLQAPSTRDFTNIVLFLFQQIDPTFEFGPLFAEEVPTIFRRIRYPFAINKSHMSAVGAPHAWPTLLAALFWLVELLEYGDRIGISVLDDEAAPGVDPKGDSQEKFFFEYLAKSYDSFLRGEDGDELERELADQFVMKQQVLEQQIVSLRNANAQIKEEIQQCSQSAVEGLQEQKATLQSDVDKFKKLLVSLSTHVSTSEKKVAELKEEAAGKENEIIEITNEIASLTKQVAEQPVSAADAQRMMQERNQLRDRVAVVSDTRDRAREAMFASEVQVSKKLSEVERDVHEYRSQAGKLKLLQSGSKRACGYDVDIRINSSGDALENMLALNCKATTRPCLEAIKENTVTRLRERMHKKVELEDLIRSSNDALLEKREEIASLEKEVERHESELRREKEARESEFRNRVAKCREIEEGAMRVKSDVAQRLSRSRQELTAARAELEELEANLQLEERQMRECISGSLSRIAAHKLSVQENLHQLAFDVGAIYAEVQN